MTTGASGATAWAISLFFLGRHIFILDRNINNHILILDVSTTFRWSTSGARTRSWDRTITTRRARTRTRTRTWAAVAATRATTRRTARRSTTITRGFSSTTTLYTYYQDTCIDSSYKCTLTASSRVTRVPFSFSLSSSFNAYFMSSRLANSTTL